MGCLSHLKLRNFRNYAELVVDLEPGLSILKGANGEGKTSILEAIYYLSLLRSFRTRSISELQMWGRGYFAAEARLVSGRGPLADETLSVIYGERRRLKINGAPITKASEFINRFLCVAFVPEDIRLVKGSPGRRRRFLDILLSQTTGNYLFHLIKYQAALKARNAVLKEPGRYGKHALAAYDKLLSENGAEVVVHRGVLVDALNETLATRGSQLFGDQRRCSVRYRSNVLRRELQEADTETIGADFAKVLMQEMTGDVEAGTTRYGPHRDDISLYLDGKPVGVFGSEGQQRLFSLALRLASVDIMGERCAEDKPLLLVDDVLGELDESRRAAFLSAFRETEQVVLACTRIPDELEGSGNRFRVSAGTCDRVT